MSNQTVIGYHRVLRKWFNDAKRHIPYNPVTDATPPSVVRQSRPVWEPGFPNTCIHANTVLRFSPAREPERWESHQWH